MEGGPAKVLRTLTVLVPGWLALSRIIYNCDGDKYPPASQNQAYHEH